MNILIIGYGSIGKRHYSILSSFKNIDKLAIVTKQKLDIKTFSTLYEIENLDYFDYFIICNETFLHYETLWFILKKVKNKRILVEKPLFEKVYTLDNLNNNIYVAYNMRFHPIIKELKKIILKQDVIYANIQVGQYLPDWRKNIDYRDNYSAFKEKGGGVLLDLSHELDYIAWLFGQLSFKSAISSKISNLEISSDDIFTSLAYANNTIVNLTMDYLNKNFIRNILFYTNEMTVTSDLVKNFISINYNNGQVKKIDFGDIERNLSFIEMHKNILEYNGKDVCSFEEGIEILKIIDGVKYNG